MFWWLYYADSQTAQYKDLPLVMWLQVGHEQVHCDLMTGHVSTCFNLFAPSHTLHTVH